jgi:hypothetical protein
VDLNEKNMDTREKCKGRGVHGGLEELYLYGGKLRWLKKKRKKRKKKRNSK